MKKVMILLMLCLSVGLFAGPVRGAQHRGYRGRTNYSQVTATRGRGPAIHIRNYSGGGFRHIGHSARSRRCVTYRPHRNDGRH